MTLIRVAHSPDSDDAFMFYALAKGLLDAGTNHGMIAIHGWPGVGKTTFAAALANDAAVQDGFPDGIIWMPMGLAFKPISGFKSHSQMTEPATTGMSAGK